MPEGDTIHYAANRIRPVLAGHVPDEVRTTAEIDLRSPDTGPPIRKITLRTTGRVPGIDAETFERTAQEAKQACLVTRALAGVPNVTIEASFES